MTKSTSRAVSHTRKAPARRPRLSKVTNARDALKDFGPGRETYCLTFGQFSLMDALIALLEHTGPAHVAISTWTAGSADLSRSAELLRDERFLSMRWVVDRSFPTRQPGYAAELVRLFGEESIAMTRTHAKFAVLTNETWSVAVRTSMNLNENPRLESIECSDDPSLAGFLLTIVDEIFAHGVDGVDGAGLPRLPGVPAVEAAPSVSMSRVGVSTGVAR